MLPGEFVEYPGVHTAKHDLIPLGGLPQPWHSVQHPEQPHGHHLMTVRSVPGHHQPLVTITKDTIIMVMTIMVTIIMIITIITNYYNGHNNHGHYHHGHCHGGQGLTLTGYWAHLIIQLEDPGRLVPGKPRS